MDEQRWDLLRVLADACEEAGDTTTARGLRWLVKYRKWPLRDSSGQVYWSFGDLRRDCWSLPWVLYRYLEVSSEGEVALYAKDSDAIADAALAQGKREEKNERARLARQRKRDNLEQKPT